MLEPEQSSARARLVSTHLHEGEVLEGTFEVTGEQVVAVTSERLIMVTGGGSRGWQLMGIPWRLVTGAELQQTEASPYPTVHVCYAVRTRRTAPNKVAEETESTLDLSPTTDGDAERMFQLIDERRAQPVPATESTE